MLIRINSLNLETEKILKKDIFFKKKFFLFLHKSSKFVIALKKKKIIFKFLKILNPHQDTEYRRMIFLQWWIKD